MERVVERPLQIPTPADEDGMVTPEKVVFTVRRIVTLTRPVRVVAFGSRARGTHRQESDLDLAVILRDFDQTRDRPPIRRADLDVWMSMDLLVVGKERHDFMRDSIVSVHHDIANEGVILYDESVGSIDFGAVARVGR